MNLVELTAHEAGDLLRRREISSIELTDAVLEQIERRDSTIHAYLTVTAESARRDAVEVDRRFARGEEALRARRGPLRGRSRDQRFRDGDARTKRTPRRSVRLAGAPA